MGHLRLARVKPRRVGPIVGLDKHRQPHMMRVSQPLRNDDVTESGPGARVRRQDAAGQVAVEWLMVAGILTAVAIILTGMFEPVLVSVVRMLARSVRTVGL